MNEIKAVPESSKQPGAQITQKDTIPDNRENNVIDLDEQSAVDQRASGEDRSHRSPEALSMPQYVGLDSVSGPAYMVNNQFEVEWANEPANNELFCLTKGLSEDITECSVFPLLLSQSHIQAASDRDEILKFHLIAAKNRIPRSRLYSLGSSMDGDDVETLLKTYDEVEAADRATLLHTKVNIAPIDGPASWCIIYASFFREGIFFKPVEQLCAKRCDNADLRIVDMAVHETGQDQIVAVIVPFRPVSQTGRFVARLPGPDDMAAFDQYGAVFGIAHSVHTQAGIAVKGQRSAGQQQPVGRGFAQIKHSCLEGAKRAATGCPAPPFAYSASYFGIEPSMPWT